MISWRVRVLSPVSRSEVRWLDDAIVRIDGGRFVEIERYQGQPVGQDLRPAVLLPGFVDSHVHAAQTRVVGRATGTLLSWLEETVFPEESELGDPTVAGEVASAFCERIAAAGTTLCLALGSVHRQFAHTLLAHMDERGLQGIVAPAWMDRDSPLALTQSVSTSVDDLSQLHQRWHGHDHHRLTVAVFPRFALSCSTEAMTVAARIARDHDLLITTHLSETVDEEAAVRDRFGVSDYLEVYEQAGLVGPRSVFAHCVQLRPEVWDRLAAAGSIVAHCPDSNDFLGSGGMPVAEVLDRDIPLTIGTDVAAGRSFRVPRSLSAVRDNALRHGVSPSMASLLWWGTRGAAVALGFPHTGALEPGLQADACLFRPPANALTPDQVLGSLFFDHDQGPMQATWVRGRRVWGTVSD